MGDKPKNKKEYTVENYLTDKKDKKSKKKERKNLLQPKGRLSILAFEQVAPNLYQDCEAR